MSTSLTLNIFHTFSSASIVDFEQVNFSWVITGSNTIDNNMSMIIK